MNVKSSILLVFSCSVSGPRSDVLPGVITGLRWEYGYVGKVFAVVEIGLITEGDKGYGDAGIPQPGIQGCLTAEHADSVPGCQGHAAGKEKDKVHFVGVLSCN